MTTRNPTPPPDGPPPGDREEEPAWIPRPFAPQGERSSAAPESQTGKPPWAAAPGGLPPISWDERNEPAATAAPSPPAGDEGADGEPSEAETVEQQPSAASSERPGSRARSAIPDGRLPVIWDEQPAERDEPAAAAPSSTASSTAGGERAGGESAEGWSSGASGRRARSAGRAGSAAAADDPFSGAEGEGAGGGSAGAEAVAREVCLRLLAASPRTRAQLADALRRKNVPDEVAERVLGRFGEVGLIDDEAFALAWVQSRHTGRGLARRALAGELRRRGVAEETVNEAVETLGPEQEERTARELVVRRLSSTRSLDPAKRMRRLVGMLARKGYPSGLAYRVVKEALEEEGADLEDLHTPDLDE